MVIMLPFSYVCLSVSLLLAKATFAAICETYSYLTRDMWAETKVTKPPFQEYSDFLAKTQTKNAALTAASTTE